MHHHVRRHGLDIDLLLMLQAGKTEAFVGRAQQDVIFNSDAASLQEQVRRKKGKGNRVASVLYAAAAGISLEVFVFLKKILF